MFVVLRDIESVFVCLSVSECYGFVLGRNHCNQWHHTQWTCTSTAGSEAFCVRKRHSVDAAARKVLC